MEEAFFVRIAPYDMHIDALSRPPRARSLCLALAGLAALWLCSLPLACLPGPFPLGVNEVFRALAASLGLAAAPVDASQLLVVGQIRLARVCLAALCGGALAVAGVALQGVLRNPLADPFTLGISAGAACGASMAIALGGVGGGFVGAGCRRANIALSSGIYYQR